MQIQQQSNTHTIEDGTLKNNNAPNSIPDFLSNIELDLFREKTNQLMENLESNDIASAQECINEINEINGKNFYSVIGKLTRGLHDAISDLSISSVQNQPKNNKTRVDLNYVINLTADAAKKTLDMTEQSAVIIHALSQNASDQASLIEEYLSSHSPDAETSSLLASLSALGQESQASIVQLHSNNTEIIVAQNFQDIASQTITKAIHIINEVENSLVLLTQYATLLSKLSQYSDQDEDGLKLEDSEEIRSNIGQLNTINESEHLDQGDVDDLLSSLGF